MTQARPTESETTAAEIVRIEAQALLALADRLETADAQVFADAVQTACDALRDGRRIACCGIGKSGLVARKTAATLRSLGAAATFLHAAEAVHGDLGALRSGDIVLAFSYSGETEEMLRLLPALRTLGVVLIALTGCTRSSLALASRFVLDTSVEREACEHQLAPTASTAVMMALGDALAIGISRRLGFAPKDFAALHPGGMLGRRLVPVSELMHTGEALPSVAPTASMPALIHEMSAKRLGMTVVEENGRLLGVLSDGDLRRLFEASGADAFAKTAADVMNPRPRTIPAETKASEAFARMEAHRITSLIVTADGTLSGSVLGVVHLHDLWQAEPTKA